jgi:ribulose-phosphate 3-epimerase
MSTKELLGAVQVAPSILSADFGRLREQVDEVLAAGARVIHCDVMDGHFVPSLTLGPNVVAALAETVHAAGAILDVHLMIERPERSLEEFIRAGGDSITVHAEATPHLAYALNLIREAGACAGVAINPGTPAEALADVGGVADLILCMTVNPGWGGQAFIDQSLQKLPRVTAVAGGGTAIEVDGGIDTATAPRCRKAGANVFVAGSAIFGESDPAAAYALIAGSLRAAA